MFRSLAPKHWKTMNRKRRKQFAFTLIELLVVIAIVGILSALIIVGMNSTTQKATIAKAQVFSNSLRNSLMGNLVSEWKFDDASSGSSTAATDSWNGINNGVLTNFNFNTTDGWRTGSDCVSGNCLMFDGANDYVDCGDGTTLKIIGDITISAWVKPIVLTADNRVFTNFVYMQNGYAMNIFANGRFYFSTWQAAAEQRTESSVGEVTIGNWNYLTITRRGTVAKTYRNGIDATASSASHLDPLPSTVSAKIGINGGWPFNGLMDDVRVYNAAVPTSQIKQNYFVGLNKLFAKTQINIEEYQQRLAELSKNYAEN